MGWIFAAPLTRTLKILLFLIGMSGLLACAGPSARDMAFAELFWIRPANLMAQTRIPDGLDVQGPVRLVMILVESPENPPRGQSFTLTPTDTSAGAYQLASADFGRFTKFQDRVVASIGSPASISVRLDVPYCAHPVDTVGRGAPVAEMIDRSSGQTLMSSPAGKTARELHGTLPPCIR